jgi:predicted ATPase
MAVIESAIEQARLSEERWCWPELLRIKGEVLLLGRGAGTADAVERLFEQALIESPRQRAVSWELRAATSLTRLRRSQAVDNDASTALAEVYARFTEGFATAGLVAAKALLEEAESRC